jgi:hypothetical protein
MVLDFAALDTDILLELTLRGVESIAQGDVNVLVRLFVVMIAADHDLFLRHAQIDPDFKEITLMLMMMFRFDGDSTADDVIAELFQLGGFFPNAGFNGVGMRNSSERNL